MTLPLLSIGPDERPLLVVSKPIELAVVAFFSLLSLVMHWASGATAAAQLLALVSATIVLGICPGLLLLRLFFPKSREDFFERLALSIAISLVVIQILIVLSIVFHIPLSVWAAGLQLLILTAALVSIFPSLRAGRSTLLNASPLGLLLSIILFGTAAFLYLKGSPFEAGEDSIHLSIIRRLTLLSAPSLSNLYYTPDFIYTYPFPGLHGFYSLASILSGLDPVFVYHKLRFFWFVPSILSLYVASKAIFSSYKLAGLTALSATAFVLNGAFAEVVEMGSYWAQLAPVSHISDVAMNVVLPCLLAVFLSWLSERDRGPRIFLLVLTYALFLFLSMVHPREIVQFLVYCGAFWLALGLVERGVTFRRMTGFLLVIVGMFAAYSLWHKAIVHHIDTSVTDRRNELMGIARNMSWSEYFAKPFLHPNFTIASEFLFYRLNGLILLLSTALFYFLRLHRSLLFIASGIFAYLVILRFPIVSIPYIYATYFEILYTPVRNFVFFIYLLTGVLVCTLGGTVEAVWRNVSGWRRYLLVVGVPLAVILAAKYFGPALAKSASLQKLWFLLCLGGLVIYLVWFKRIDGKRRPLTAGIFSSLLILIPLLMVTASPNSFSLGPRRELTTQQKALEYLTDCTDQGPLEIPHPIRRETAKIKIDKRVNCAPSMKLTEWSRKNLNPMSIVASNSYNSFMYGVLMAVQTPALPVVLSWGFYYRETFPDFSKIFFERFDKTGDQPFFNDRDSLAERKEFLKSIRATHVLVDPMYYEMLIPLLRGAPENFVEKFDDGHWAVFEFRPS